MTLAVRNPKSKFSIRFRLLLALGLLAGATVFVGVLAWVALDRADNRLENVHRQTLSEVARALSLSKRSSDLATTAPYMLNLQSPYLIRAEGENLLRAIGEIERQWPNHGEDETLGITSFERLISQSLDDMKLALTGLTSAADNLNNMRDSILRLRAELVELEREYFRLSNQTGIPVAVRQEWQHSQRLANALVGAVHAENLLGVGENRRKYTSLLAQTDIGNPEVTAHLRSLADGQSGLFEIRRIELAQNLAAQNALFRIRYHAGSISGLAEVFAISAEEFLSTERLKTASSIDYAKLTIIGASIASVTLALLSALFVSGYVTANIRAISDAMVRLAAGDRSPSLPRQDGPTDEIGKLMQSFRVFRANALRLDRSNRQLHQQNTLFEKIFNNISDGVAIIDDNGQLSAVNPCFSNILRLGDGVKTSRTGIVDVLAASPFARAASERKLGKNFRRTSEIQCDDGSVVEIRCSRLPDGGEVWLFTDATERRLLDERLGEIQRIESLGKVTGEVAHDFGNILSTISGNLHLLESKPEKSDTSVFRRRIAGAVEIGTSLTERLLAFARRQRLDPEEVELNTLVEGLADLVRIGLKKGVVLETSQSNAALYARVDPGQLESAILNLCLNSNQSIAESGLITITVRSDENDCAQIIVTDDGCGMEKPVLKQAMEPFFSARADGEGTGLGLSMVYGFIKQSGGEFHIKSTAGRGTEVCLTFPRQGGVVADLRPSGPGKRILLVEDEPQVMADTARLLHAMGHWVDQAGSFEDAQGYLDQSAPYDVLLTDVHLDNGQSGWQLVDRCLNSELCGQLIVASGKFSDDTMIADRFVGHVTCLSKPLTPDMLVQAMAQGVASAGLVAE